MKEILIKVFALFGMIICFLVFIMARVIFEIFVDIGAYEYFSVPVSVIPQIYDLVLALAGADREVVAPLQDAIQTLQDSDSSNDGEAVGHLQAFITEVEERSNQALTDAEADELIAEAERIIAIERVSVREEMGGLTN